MPNEKPNFIYILCCVCTRVCVPKFETEGWRLNHNYTNSNENTVYSYGSYSFGLLECLRVYKTIEFVIVFSQYDAK